MEGAEHDALDRARGTNVVNRPARELRLRRLQLDDEAAPRDSRSSTVAEAGDADARGHETDTRVRQPADRAVNRVAGIDARELVRGARGERSARVGRPIERVVVMHDDHAVARQVDVELQTIGAERQPMVERHHRVLRPQRRAAAMGEDERPGQPGLRKLGQGSHLSRASM